MLDAAGMQLRAMILLGVNCGFGNADVGTLPLSALDLDGGWVDYPRPKTGVPRRAPCGRRPSRHSAGRSPPGRAPKDAAHAGLVFVTKQGGTGGNRAGSRSW